MKFGRQNHVTVKSKIFFSFLIIPDGNCMYRALAQALAHDQNQHPVLRKEVVGYIKENKYDFEVRYAVYTGTCCSLFFLLN